MYLHVVRRITKHTADQQIMTEIKARRGHPVRQPKNKTESDIFHNANVKGTLNADCGREAS